VNVFNINPQYLEVTGINTFQQAMAVKKMLASKSSKKIYLITHAWHMKRAVAEFTLQGFDVHAAPMGFAATSAIENLYLPTATALASSSRALHEYYGLFYLKLVN
ncbi:MAG: YdcF family protein, partial [Gammaproteobacteria bacterium]|nr:YdcF family protein [Gammaproteobacteria bacterium]